VCIVIKREGVAPRDFYAYKTLDRTHRSAERGRSKIKPSWRNPQDGIPSFNRVDTGTRKTYRLCTMAVSSFERTAGIYFFPSARRASLMRGNSYSTSGVAMFLIPAGTRIRYGAGDTFTAERAFFCAWLS
jgi:hypothetical protein